jgi:hypothetical protein
MTAGALDAVAALAVACGDESADDTLTLDLDTAQADTDFGAPAADRVTNSYVAALDEKQAIGVVLPPGSAPVPVAPRRGSTLHRQDSLTASVKLGVRPSSRATGPESPPPARRQ